MEDTRGIAVLGHFCESHGPTFIFCTQQLPFNNPYYVIHKDPNFNLQSKINEKINKKQQKRQSESFQYPDPYASLVINDQLRSQVARYAEQVKAEEEQRESNQQAPKAEESAAASAEESESETIDVVMKEERNYSNIQSKEGNCSGCASISSKTGYISLNNPTYSENDHIDEQTFSISSKYPADSLFPIVRTVAVRSIICECAGKEGAMIFSEAEGKLWVLSYNFKLYDSDSHRGNQRIYSFIIIHSDSARLFSSFHFISSHFNQYVASLQQISSSTPPPAHSAPTRSSRSNFHTSSRAYYRSNHALRPLTTLLRNPNFFVDLHLHFSHALAVINSHIYQKSFGRISFDKVHPTITEEAVLKIGIELINHLSPYQTRSLIENIIVGNQIIIQAPSPVESSLLVEFLKHLLPVECCEIRSYSEFYLEAYECNFLGLHPSVKIPTHLPPATYFLIEVTPGNKFNIFGELRGESKLSEQLTNILRSDLPNRSMSILMDQIRIVINDWRNKSRVYFRLSKSPDSEKTIPALLKILQLKPSDLPPIRFFTTGFRQTMLRMHLWQKIS